MPRTSINRSCRWLAPRLLYVLTGTQVLRTEYVAGSRPHDVFLCVAVGAQQRDAKINLGLPNGQPPRLTAGRKVRSPQGSVPANGRGATLKG